MGEIAKDLGLTENELVQALQEALTRDEDTKGGLTARELAEAAGVGIDYVREGLRLLKQQGIIETVRVQRRDLADRLTRLPGYRLRREGGQDV